MIGLIRPGRTAARLALLLAFLLPLSCDSAPEPDDGTDRGAFITRLGADTLAVEQFVRTPTRMVADVVLRTPETTVRHYILETDTTGALRRYEATVRDPGAPADAPPREQDVVTVQGDRLLRTVVEGGETRTDTLTGSADMLPFLDMIHWPFEIMLARAYASGRDSVAQDLFAGRNPLAFVIRRAAEDTMTVQHPFRGTMRVHVDRRGRLLHLDAGATTRKLTVERVPTIDLDALARTFAERDAQGLSFGPLSSRGETRATVHGATITVDYGRPAKREREIFGALVPWNEVWRTGANRATHFETDRDLVVGGLDVPAGQYTLYTIPAPSGGTLIINRQTGQGGTTYDAAQDLGRVDLTMGTLPETVEVFTILVEETADGGVLKLQWDRTELSVPFRVKA